jgi:selenocysteine lyase/cysteine desulfurase
LKRVGSELHARGEALVAQLWNGLSEIKGVRCYGPPPGRPRTPTISFTIEGVPSEKAAEKLADWGVFVSHGHFYATTVVEKLGQGREGVVRAGCACYTTAKEVERLLAGVRKLARKSGN